MKNFAFWAAAVIITLSAVVYQRITGPTNPKRVSFEIDGTVYKTKLTRSLETDLTLDEAKGNYNSLGKKSQMKINISPVNEELSLEVRYRVYPGNDTLTTAEVIKGENGYTIILPSQPPAGKLEYQATIKKNGEEAVVYEESVRMRFKSPVPSFILIPHILLMFIGMLLSNYAGLIAYNNGKKSLKYALYVLVAIGLGGLVLGPVVQKFAFGAYWTGWPFGEDLTDNKTLFIFIVWLVAWFLNRKITRRYLLVIAAILTLLVYSIPHSTGGSEYDHEKGMVVSGR
jgi:hypothetical protein